MGLHRLVKAELGTEAKQKHNFHCLSSKGHLCVLLMGTGDGEKRWLQITGRLFACQREKKELSNKDYTKL